MKHYELMDILYELNRKSSIFEYSLSRTSNLASRIHVNNLTDLSRAKV
jgi:hypothetical protein